MYDFEHNGYKVYESSAGFEHGNGNFMIQSYIAAKDNKAYGFAFCINTLAAALQGVNPTEPVLVQKARQTVTQRLDNDENLTDREEYTFEYDLVDEIFEEVTDATWWIKFPR